MNIGLFGGSFDPIHRGHVALAQAAAERFSLHKVLFVPANVPPHKQKHPVTLFVHRYAMVTLATQDEKRFLPSLVEAPAEIAPETRSGRGRILRLRSGQASVPTQAAPNYSIDTVRLLKKGLKKADRLFFVMGIDAFREIAKWHDARALFGECEFIVASRPGFSLKDVAESLPEGLRPASNITKPFQKQPATGDLVLPGLAIHLLEGVQQNVSATAIREAAAAGKPLGKWLDPRVAEYVRKMGLYRKSEGKS